MPLTSARYHDVDAAGRSRPSSGREPFFAFLSFREASLVVAPEVDRESRRTQPCEMVNQASFHYASSTNDSDQFDLRSEGPRRGLINGDSRLLCMENLENPEIHTPRFVLENLGGMRGSKDPTVGGLVPLNFRYFEHPPPFPDDLGVSREAFIRRYCRFG